MPNGGPEYNTKSTNLATYIDADIAKSSKLNKLSTDSLNLIDLLFLMVDIEYRHKYGGSLERRSGRGYSKQYEVLADQLSLVDDVGSARLKSTGDNCNEA